MLLMRGGMEAMAHVVWSSDGRCGLEFFDALSYDEVVRQARELPQVVEAAITPYPHLFGVRADGLSVEEWHTAKARALKARH